LTLLSSLRFLTPLGGFVALAGLVPLVAFMLSSQASARGRAVLGLAPPEAEARWTFLALVAVPLLLGLAAAGPAFRTHVGKKIRNDAQAIFIFDTSRSMAAAAGFKAPTRLDEAQAAAMQLRADAIPDVPSGVASLTTELLPHLFPTTDVDAFNTTVEDAIGIEKPPPPFLTYGILGTSFGPLAELRNEGFFNPTTKHRLAILLSDGESGAIEPSTIGQALTLASGPPSSGLFRGIPARAPEPPVSLFIVRVGSSPDRIYDSDGHVERAYRPDPTAAGTVASLAAAAHARVFTTADLSQAGSALREALGSGGSHLEGSRTKTFNLAPFVALAALIPLAFVVFRRNLTHL
jgi:hypothetical protein